MVAKVVNKKATVKVKVTLPLIWLFRIMKMRIKLLVKTKMMTKMKKELIMVVIRKLLKRREMVRISTVPKAKTWACEDLMFKDALMTLFIDSV